MTLADLLQEARAAAPDRRIEWRDRIAAHGALAIEAVDPWLVDTALAAFAVRVIERVGALGEPDLAGRVLRAARSRVPAQVRSDVDWALQRLRAAMRTAPPPAKKAAPARVRVVRQARPRFTPVGQGRSD